jgi:hypothetical protein
MRRLFTTEEALARGLTIATLKWGARTGRWRRICKGVYGVGPDEPTNLDRARGRVLVHKDGVASGGLAGVLHGLDSVELDDHPVRRRRLAPERVVMLHGTQCTDGLQTLIDLAATLDDLVWEQALEAALRKRLMTVDALEAALPLLGRAHVPGTARVRRVLALRPSGAPPTESLLETLMVQLARTADKVPDPVRQYRVEDRHAQFVARVDLAWPDLGLFVELDGEKHKGRPLYDAIRETAVVAATGWLCGRFTWTEVVHHPASTRRRLAAVVDQARRRPLASVHS